MRLLKRTFLLVVSLFIFNKSQAQQQYGNISDFIIRSPFTNSSGQVIINNQTITEVKFRVNFNRNLEAGGNWNWKYTDITVGLGSYDSNGILIVFDGITRITNADFEQYKGFLEKEFTAKIDNSKLVAGRKIVLVVKPTPSPSFQQYLSRSFDFVFTRPELFEVGTWLINAKGSANAYRLSINGMPPTGMMDYFTYKKFYAYKKTTFGATPIYEFVGPESYDFIYSTNLNSRKQGSSSSIIFYAFKTQIPGTIPVYEYIHNAEGGFGYAYTAVDIKMENEPWWTSKTIVFYAYPNK